MAPPTIPPELPPSVEAAYRLKCIQLKTRLNEVEESNDASRLRIERLNRAIYKGRLERAFLLEQLAKRTSTNVEDSEGSPSPPPTPKEKPLRTKRGHRKPDYLTADMDGRVGSTFIQQGPVTLSPSSDAFSHTHHVDPLRHSTPQGNAAISSRRDPPNGHQAPNVPTSGSSKTRPKSPFEIFCEEQRPGYEVDTKDEREIQAKLARGWAAADDDVRDAYLAKFESQKKEIDTEKDRRDHGTAEAVDEDVEMADDVGTPAAGGFHAVNN